MKWFYSTWLLFLIRYRRTALGPAWMIVGPSIFILLLGRLYAGIGGHASETFVPHLTIGLIVWTLFNGFIIGGTTIFQRGSAQIMQGSMRLFDIVIIDVISTVLTFAHQLVIIAAVFVIYEIPLTAYSLLSLVGVALIVVNGIWVSLLFGIIGARFRDLAEISNALMRIAMFATPIIWMPGAGMRGSGLEIFLNFNPFYHFLELVRAPLLGSPITPLSWAVVICVTGAGFTLSYFANARYARYVPLWV